MANLKELRNKINVVQSTRKVTSAMKLVAGVKLRRAEQKAFATREYAAELQKIISQIRREFVDEIKSELFNGREHVKTEMLIVFASDRGLCGNFNYLISKEVIKNLKILRAEGQKIHLLCIGEKAYDFCKRIVTSDEKIEKAKDFYKGDVHANAKIVADKIISEFQMGEIDKVSVIYNRYYSAVRKQIEVKSLIPIVCEPTKDPSVPIFEPNVNEVLNAILPYNVAIQLYQCALESITSEQSSRMTSMDSATRNADEMISDLSIKYNRTRQYNITQELVEVISGANAISKG